MSATIPQPPQFLSSVCVLTIEKVGVSGAPATGVVEGQHDVGFVGLSGSAVCPQLVQLKSVPFAVGVPSQQSGVCSVQTTPQPPQLLTSAITSMHDPSQHFWLAEQISPQPVQLVSVPISVHVGTPPTVQQTCPSVQHELSQQTIPSAHEFGQSPQGLSTHVPEQHFCSGVQTGV